MSPQNVAMNAADPNFTGPLDSREPCESIPFIPASGSRAAIKHLLKTCGIRPRANLRKQLRGALASTPPHAIRVTHSLHSEAAT
jgi:hypothetical protein